MKAIFKLSPAQIRKARDLENDVAGEIARADADQERYNEGLWAVQPSRLLDCGLYTLETHAATNGQQGVYLDGDTLVVQGHRCALAQDGGFAVAESVVGMDAVPVSYKTSDTRLRWNETLSSYIKSRGTREERLAYVLDGRASEWRWYLPPKIVNACFELARSPARASAQFSDADIRIARRIINACSL